jgi:hypothetical protein
MFGMPVLVDRLRTCIVQYRLRRSLAAGIGSVRKLCVCVYVYVYMSVCVYNQICSSKCITIMSSTL